MKTIEAPTRAELVGRATDLIPLIRSHAEWQEEHRVMHEETLKALVDAGLHKMRLATRYGGYESDMGTVTDVITALSRGDGSTGWIASVWNISGWLAGLFPDHVQDEIFADPDTRVCGSVGPNGIAAPTEGGVILNGKWHFMTAAQQSQWMAHACLLPTDDGGFLPGLVAVKTEDLTIIDDWYTSGIRGSGSVTTVAENLFVPQERVLNMIPVLTQGQFPSERNADSPLWRGAPFLPGASAVASAVPYGIAQAAREAFFEQLPDHTISYTNYEHQADAAVTHLQAAEATTKVDEAGFHVQRAAERVDDKALTGDPWTLEDRVIARMDMGATCARAKEAVDIYTSASGASGVYSSKPMQRLERDVQTMNLHGLMQPNTNAELYGRVLCGLEPNTNFL
jgi:3-hydroxy-9,10-secoandrosta-1,3,5(10)-triene-9,17-dione monooxygenase